MNIRIGTLLIPAFGLIFAAASANAQPKIPPKYPATPLEIAYLPKYCYHQYVDGALHGPEFEMPADLCGYEMNHFCPALVLLTQANQPSRSKTERRGALNSAIKEIEYTLRGMKPGCFVAQDVQRAKERAHALSTVLK